MRLAVRILMLLVALAVASMAGPCLAAEDLAGKLEAEREKARQRETRLLQLSKSEERLHGELARAAERIRSLEQSVGAKEKDLAAIRAREAETQERLAELTATKRELRKEAAEIVGRLWPLHVAASTAIGQGDEGRDQGAWERADRQGVWLAGLYDRLEGVIFDVRARQAEVRAALAEQQELAGAAKAALDELRGGQDALLRAKLDLGQKLSGVREEKADIERELSRILDAITALNYSLQELSKGKAPAFGGLKGILGWPARGRVVSRYAPKANPPVKGLGLAVAEGAPVTAVAYGKVVHDDVLRGFGRVVILMHGEDYYSVYMFLADSAVDLGQEVGAGHVLGRAGYYPAAKGPGVYFELRFHQKAINPEGWLAAR